MGTLMGMLALGGCALDVFGVGDGDAPEGDDGDSTTTTVGRTDDVDDTQASTQGSADATTALGTTGDGPVDTTGEGDESSIGDGDESSTGEPPATVCENVLANPSVESGNLDGWQVTQSGGAVIDGTAHDGSYAVHTSYQPFTRQQEIDLVAAGISPAFLDTSPDIVVEDWFREVYASDEYLLRVELRDENHDTIEQWVVNDTTPGEGGTYDDDTYFSVGHTFSGYPSGLRYLLFRDGGQDGEYWAGNYGVIIDASRVEICHPR